MNSGRNEREIQELAYNIWEAEGRPVGQAERHWNMALGQSETISEQSMLGENVAGDSFLGDSVNSDGLADIIPDSQQYSKSQSEIPQQVVQGSASRSSSTAESKNKRRPGKKKSSDNILV